MGASSLAFLEWANTEGVSYTNSLEEIRGKRLLVDAEHLLDTLLTAQPSREPLLPALGGLPFALKKHVDNYLRGVKDADLKATFVFNGLTPECKDRAAIARESRAAAASLNEAWSLYGQGKADDAVAEFGKSCNYQTYHILGWFRSYLRSQGQTIITAPSVVAAQLNYMAEQNIGDFVVGSMSCFIFGGVTIVLGFDWDAKTFTWANKAHILTKLALNDTQFTDLALLSGLTIMAPAPVPEVENSTGPIQPARLLLSRGHNDGLLVCEQIKNEAYTELYKKAKTVIAHHPVLERSGKLKISNEADAPGNLHEVIGQRLPDLVYYWMSRGVVGHRMLEWRTRQEIFEISPLDGGASPAYQNLVSQKLAPLRTRAMALLTRSLHFYYQKKDIDWVCWYDESQRKALDLPDVVQSGQRDSADRWHVEDTVFSTVPEVDKMDIKDSPLLFAVTLLSHAGAAQKSVTENSGSASQLKVNSLSSARELLGNTVLRFLEDRGYINNDHTLSTWGKALKAALDEAKANGYMKAAESASEAEEAIFMAFELQRLDILNTSQMFPSSTYLGAPMRGTDTDRAYTLLLSRVTCLGTFHHKEIGFTGPLSRHLLAYHQMTAAVRGSLRDLLEMHALNMLLKGASNNKLTPLDYSIFGSQLPFVREPDLGLSLVVKSYLDELSGEKRADITKWFHQAYDIPGDLEKAWKMWGAINAGIQAADSGIVNNDTKATFKNADEWLQAKLKSASVNGTS